MWSCHPLVGGHLCQEHVCSSQNKQVKTNFLWRVWWLVKRDTSKAVGDFRSHLVLRALGGTWLFKNANAGDEKKRVKRKMAIVIGFIGTRPVWAIFVEACLLVLFLWAYQLVLFLIQTLTSIFFNVCWPAMSVFPNTHIICSPPKNGVCFPCVFAFLCMKTLTQVEQVEGNWHHISWVFMAPLSQ